jgi:hypothetical protein
MTPELRILGYFNPDQGRAWARKSVMLTMADEGTLEQMVAKGLLRKSFFNEYARGENADLYKPPQVRKPQPVKPPTDRKIISESTRAKLAIVLAKRVEKATQDTLNYIIQHQPVSKTRIRKERFKDADSGRVNKKLDVLVARGCIEAVTATWLNTSNKPVVFFATPEKWKELGHVAPSGPRGKKNN